MVQVNGRAVGPIRIIVQRLFPGRLPGLDKRLARWAENRHRLGRFYKAKAIGLGLRSNRIVRANGLAICYDTHTHDSLHQSQLIQCLKIKLESK